MSAPLRIAFPGCGFITDLHNRQLRPSRQDVTISFASRDGSKADARDQIYATVA